MGRCLPQSFGRRHGTLTLNKARPWRRNRDMWPTLKQGGWNWKRRQLGRPRNCWTQGRCSPVCPRRLKSELLRRPSAAKKRRTTLEAVTERPRVDRSVSGRAAQQASYGGDATAGPGGHQGEAHDSGLPNRGCREGNPDQQRGEALAPRLPERHTSDLLESSHKERLADGPRGSGTCASRLGGSRAAGVSGPLTHGRVCFSLSVRRPGQNRPSRTRSRSGPSETTCLAAAGIVTSSSGGSCPSLIRRVATLSRPASLGAPSRAFRSAS